MKTPTRTPPGAGTPRAEDARGAIGADALVARFVELFQAPSYQPPLLPGVALELLALSRKPDTTVQQIATLLEADPVLAANLLRVANSPMYSPGAPVRSLHESIVRLGTRTVTGVFFDVWANAKLFRARGFEEPMAMIRRHSAATAHLARLVCQHTALDDDYAFLCGLLHDIGVAVGMLSIAEWRPRQAMPAPFEICHALRDAHAEIGGRLCELWKLPVELAYVVRHHHGIAVDGKVHPGAAIVRIAENVAIRCGFGTQIDVEDMEDEALARRALSVSEASVRLLEEDAKIVLAQLD
jgi:putative nucleotidyltransferase with HDIG domain